jgi:DNA invertase Pin-like site-specific DNA recombinase
VSTEKAPEARVLTAAASGPDPATGLRAAAALRRLADTLERAQVARARAAGWSWQDVADALGVSRQAVHKKYAATDKDRGGRDA